MRSNPWCGGASSVVRVFGEVIEHEKRGNLFGHRASWWEVCLPNKSDHDTALGWDCLNKVRNTPLLALSSLCETALPYP
jgi:hypothetical protein